MNKALYQFCQRKFKTRMRGALKLTSLTKQLHNQYGFGHIEKDHLYFDSNDRQALIEQVYQENNSHLFRDNYQVAKSRVANACDFRNEKENSIPVSDGFVLLNSFTNLLINNQQIKLSPLTSLGLYLKADEIHSIQHDFIVLVENLAIMSALSSLILPIELENALFLYRGDINPAQNTSTAYEFFRRFNDSDSLVCFSDLDPDGIQISLSSGAHYWLAPDDFSLINIPLKGYEQEWYTQLARIKWLNEQKNMPKACQSAFIEMCQSHKTLKQEHMLAHKMELSLYLL